MLYDINKINDMLNLINKYIFSFYTKGKKSKIVKWVECLLMASETRVSILGQVLPKPQKIVLGNFLLYTHHHKVHIKGKVEQSREKNCTLPNTSV